MRLSVNRGMLKKALERGIKAARGSGEVTALAEYHPIHRNHMCETISTWVASFNSGFRLDMAFERGGRRILIERRHDIRFSLLP